MLFEHTQVWGWEHAIRGMRNPMNSWDRSDSKFDQRGERETIGTNDFKLMVTLDKAGEPHRKFMRQVFVSVDITAPLYWWSEFDTYGVGVVKNSTSTMHKLASRPIEQSDFAFDTPTDELQKEVFDAHANLVSKLNKLMERYNKTKDIKDFRLMKQGLATSYLQKRTVTLNYEVLSNMVRYRKHHRLSEWSIDFMNWVSQLPYSKLILMNADEPGEVHKSIRKEACKEIFDELHKRVDEASADGENPTAATVMRWLNEMYAKDGGESGK
jgi:hypothetical protein